MLSKNDLTQIKLLLVSNNSQALKGVDELKEKIEKIDNKINFLPTKEEYFGSMDKLMGEVKAIRESQETSGNQLADHSDKLENHEERIGKLETKASFPAI
jgi:chromosome segregation ATPase